MLFKDWMKIDDWLIRFKCLNTRNKHAKEVLLISSFIKSFSTVFG